jgi:preprotein translocase subunit YajC
MNAGPLIFLAAMIAVFWFLLIRPQRQRQAAHRNLIAQLAPGDEIVTAGGMIGTLRSIEEDHLAVEIAPGTEVRIAKEAVTGVRRKDEESAASETEGRG